ncbi:hypothetical protein PGTUg99_008056 [Puccinia graminis f. sp. tritici]|uniref:Uncharacterized protein n=1 Tax=Puccinia graminis f. sp. tritici TaxID=56615 RepID=A0A5B0M3L6_PUCGR|nr:hypothetical protein PGTUg99_008056 [Puccinia graminis f. sp. tritici]
MLEALIRVPSSPKRMVESQQRIFAVSDCFINGDSQCPHLESSGPSHHPYLLPHMPLLYLPGATMDLIRTFHPSNQHF